MYVLTNTAGILGNIIDEMTHVLYLFHTLPFAGHESCYERCFDTDICRAVSIGRQGLHTYCFYHTSDCLTEGVVGFTFMWRYCLSGKQFLYCSFSLSYTIPGPNISRLIPIDAPTRRQNVFISYFHDVHNILLKTK